MKKGFTLIELLAVIVILAVILVIAVPKVVNVIKTVKQSTLDSDSSLIAKQLELYKESEGLDVTTLEQTDLDTYGFKTDKYDGFKAEVINNKVVVTLIKDDLIGSNYAVAAIYGVRFENSSTGTRTDDAVGMTYSDPEASNIITSDFDTAEIYSEIVDVTEDGNQFVKIPKFYIKKQKLGAQTWTYQISKVKVDDDYYLPACFVDEATNTVLPYILVGKYLASLDGAAYLSSSLIRSISGVEQRTQSIGELRNWAKNNGTGYQLIDIHVWDVLQTLFYVEFATLDSQSIMAGYTATTNIGYLINGTADNILKTGSPVSNTTGTYAMKYRGIENLWGNRLQLTDGILMRNYRIYVSKDANTYTSLSVSDPISNLPISYSNLNYTASTSKYYIRELGYDSNMPFVNIPLYISSSVSSTIYKDYYWRNSDTSKNIVIAFGGWFNYGDRGGLNGQYQLPSTYSSSDASSRIVKVPIE